MYEIKVHIAGWSSSEARRAHNPKVAGSNPAPATSRTCSKRMSLFLCPKTFGLFYGVPRKTNVLKKSEN